jgi:hypothetical protein
MAAPTITWTIYSTATWYDIGGSDTIKFTGPDTVADTSWDPVTAPASGYKVADELWLDASTDRQSTQYEGGGATAAYSASPNWTLNNDDYMAIEITVNPETSAGNLTAWDTSAHSTHTSEILNDMNGNNYSWLRAEFTENNVTIDTAPDNNEDSAGYKAQTDATTTYQLKGDTYSIDAAGACTAGNANYFMIHCFVPHDASAGTTGHTPVLTYTYYYT